MLSNISTILRAGGRSARMAAEQWVWSVVAAAALGFIIIPVVWLLLYHWCFGRGEENLERDWSRLERIEEKLIAVEKL